MVRAVIFTALVAGFVQLRTSFTRESPGDDVGITTGDQLVNTVDINIMPIVAILERIEKYDEVLYFLKMTGTGLEDQEIRAEQRNKHYDPQVDKFLPFITPEIGTQRS